MQAEFKIKRETCRRGDHTHKRRGGRNEKTLSPKTSVMLRREDGGRGQEGTLPVIPDGPKNGANGDFRLAKAHVP